MNKKGFTLVELLAVITILGILAIMVLPNILKMYNEAKQKSFETELKEIYKTAQHQWVADSMYKTNARVYVRSKDGFCTSTLALNGRRELEFYIKFDKAGNVTRYYAVDGTYQYEYEGPSLKIDQIKDSAQISLIGSNTKISIDDCAPYRGNNLIIETSTFKINNKTYTFIPGMTFREWMNSSYAPSSFTVTRYSAINEYNGNISYYYFENNKEGISTGVLRYGCGSRHYLNSYEAIYNAALNRYVYLDDYINANMNYAIMSQIC